MEIHTTGPQNRTFFQEMNDTCLHILGTLWSKGHKGLYCFDSQADKYFCFSLIFPELKMPAWKNNTTKHCHAIDLTSERQPWGMTAQQK